MSSEDQSGTGEPGQMALSSLTSAELPEALRAWTGELAPDRETTRLQERLYRLVVGLAGDMLDAPAPDTEASFTPMDLAHSFLEAVLDQGLAIGVETVSGLKTALSRHLRQLRDPAAAELWTTLSDALRQLAREGKIRRLDAGWEQNNHNAAQWTLRSGAPGETPADFVEFERRAETVTRPPAKEVRRDFSEKRKIISPADARTLAIDLLHCAAGWVTMGELFRVFAGKVHLLAFDSPEEEEDAERIHADQHVPETEATLLRLAADLADRIWAQICDYNLERVFCGYFLPKEHRGENVTLEAFGSSSTVFDKSKRIKQLLQKELAPSELDADKQTRYHGRLVTETIQILETFCDCHAGNPE